MKHYYQNIRGWIRSIPNLYNQQIEKATNGAHFVEVGSFIGKSTVYMAVEIINSGKDIRFDTVDSFVAPYMGEENPYQKFKENIEPVKHVVNSYKMTSTEASKMYEDGSLDFVYIDADHSYESVKEDIAHWLPKVKSGGTIAGHDYNNPDVYKAVNESFPPEKIKLGKKGKSWIVEVSKQNNNG